MSVYAAETPTSFDRYLGSLNNNKPVSALTASCAVRCGSCVDKPLFMPGIYENSSGRFKVDRRKIVANLRHGTITPIRVRRIQTFQFFDTVSKREIFRNFYANLGKFLTFKSRILDGPVRYGVQLLLH